MEPFSLQLDGHVALVTGASRGIGHDLTLTLAQAGARAVAGVRKHGKAPRDLEAIELDLRDIGSIRAAIDDVRPTILVNNAGVGTNHAATRPARAASRCSPGCLRWSGVPAA